MGNCMNRNLNTKNTEDLEEEKHVSMSQPIHVPQQHNSSSSFDRRRVEEDRIAPTDAETCRFLFSNTPPMKNSRIFSAPCTRTDSRDPVVNFSHHDSPISFSPNRQSLAACNTCVPVPFSQCPPAIASMAQRVSAALSSGSCSRSHSLPRSGMARSKALLPYSSAVPVSLMSEVDSVADIKKKNALKKSSHNQHEFQHMAERFQRASTGASIDAYHAQRLCGLSSNEQGSESPELKNRLVAIFDYNARTDEEISLRKGDVMLVLNDSSLHRCPRVCSSFYLADDLCHLRTDLNSRGIRGLVLDFPTQKPAQFRANVCAIYCRRTPASIAYIINSTTTTTSAASTSCQPQPHLGDDESLIRPSIGIADLLGYQHVLSILTPDGNIFEQLPATRPRVYSCGILPHRKAEEGVGQQETVFRTRSQKEAVIISATETVGTQHSLPVTSKACRSVEFVLHRIRARHWGSVGADDGGELASPKKQGAAHQAIIDTLWRIGQTSHDVVFDGKGNPSVASLCLWLAAPEEVVAGTHLLQLTLLRERWEVRESDMSAMEAHTTPKTLTWFSPPVVTVARGLAAGKNPTSRSHSDSEWWFVEHCRTSAKGYVPSSYVAFEFSVEAEE
ncbi:unnamed protein product [Schistocephalus solidus]|uniref:SH3 domain-containing protein n=1 Tax=Schistocephalus solidus TaxID=70667 RepID=A0A183T5U2_SCHSO|nr:unnamed protein product [Schistocephalus solidus]